MSEINVWKYDTCFFIIKNNTAGIKNIKLADKVFSKFIDVEKINTFKTTNINKSDKELVRENAFGNGTKVIRYLPGKRGTSVTYDYSNSLLIVTGPKVIVTHLDSISGITATDEPALAGTTVSFHVNSLEEAQKLTLFLKNNKLVKLMKSKLKFKKSIKSFDLFKKFDLSQIVTGKEYPLEYGFTEDDINYIESNVK
jgi:hypothetical protein